MSWSRFRIKITRADELFSLYVRFRDAWTCGVCRWKADEDSSEDRYRLQNSHFFGRGNLSTRFDPDNCMAICQRCHTRLNGPKDARYQEVMIRRLGQPAFDALWLRGHAPGMRPDEVLMKIVWAEELKKMGVDPRTGRRPPRPLSGPGIAA